MSDVSWPSPNHGTPARAVTDAEYQHLAPWASDGLFPAATPLIYANSSGMEVHVRANRYGLVRGHAWWSGAAEFTKAITPNNSGATRLDTAVLRLDRSTWDVTLEIREGTAGSGRPSLVRDDADTGLWEVATDDITVPSGAASITAANVKPRPLLQSAAVRACQTLTDVQDMLATGDIVYEMTTGRWLVWVDGAPVVVHEDTGWQVVALDNTAWWSEGDYNLRIRRINKDVTLRGSVERHTNKLDISDTYSHVLTIASGFRPEFAHLFIGWVSGGYSLCHVKVNTNGDLSINDHIINGIAVGHRVYLFTTWRTS